MTDIVTRLRNPPFGTETSERNLMTAAADDIERLRAQVNRVAPADAFALWWASQSRTDRNEHHDWFARIAFEAGQEAGAALESTPAQPAGDASGWIVSNASKTKFRCWINGMSAWTGERDQATRYARRQDAEAVHAEDEDAWRVLPAADGDA